jgi:hypothetical protein
MKTFKWYHLLIPFFGFLGFILFVLPQESLESAELGLVMSPDTSFFYTREELFEIAESYGEEGRNIYIEKRFSFDVVWPLAYGFFLVVFIQYGVEKGKLSRLRYAYLIPIGAVLLDYLENIMTSVVMYRYPLRTFLIGDLAGIMTSLKWITLSFAFVLLVILFIRLLIKSIHQRRVNL